MLTVRKNCSLCRARMYERRTSSTRAQTRAMKGCGIVQRQGNENDINECGCSRAPRSMVGRDLSKLTVLLVVAVVWGCGRSGPSSASSAENATQPSQPALPAPSFSAAEKIGMFVYPKDNQTKDRQLRDELDCYNQVQQQTGINPETPPPAAPSSSQVQAAQQQAAEQAPQAQGGRVRGAARGAAGGAMVGAIAGDAGKGAAAGAVVGTMRGGRQQRQANAASKQQAAQSASSQMHQQYKQALAAYNAQMDTFKRGFSACMDARSYSVK